MLYLVVDVLKHVHSHASIVWGIEPRWCGGVEPGTSGTSAYHPNLS